MTVFDALRDRWPGKATAWDLGKRQVPAYCSDARVLDGETAVVADCEPAVFRRLVREWHDRGTAEETAEAMHQRDLERAAQPPVIEVTVTTPPEGMPAASLAQAVAAEVRRFAGAQRGPRDDPAPRRRKVLPATRRAARAREPVPAEVLPVSEDDTPTGPLPAVRDDGPAVAEVRVP